jgi:hypothetical protein
VVKPCARIVLAIIVCIPAAARADERERIVVRTVVALDDAFYERTVGQVSDLPVTVERAPSPSLEPSLAARLEEASALAVRRDATLIVWLEYPREAPATPTVVIAMPSRGRVLVRPIASNTATTSTSATLEAGSLVVRSALLALEAGAPLGVPTGELTRDETPTPEAARPAPLTPVRPPVLALPPRASRFPEPLSWHPFVGVGWQLSIDGRSPAGARAGVVEAGIGRDALFVLARGSLGLPSRSHDALVSLEVERHSAEAFVGWRLAVSDGAVLEGLAGAGIVVYRRAAFRRDPSFTPSAPTTHRTAAGSLELRIAWSPANDSPFRLGLSAGGDILVSPTSFSYATSEGASARRAWFIEPRLGFLASYVW